jgi:hypothetical protein
MPEYVIERDLPGAGRLTEDEIREASLRSLAVLKEMGSSIQWMHSYVTDDKIYCIYRAPNAEIIREHAEKGGFPANSVQQVRTMIDPTTAD